VVSFLLDGARIVGIWDTVNGWGDTLGQDQDCNGISLASCKTTDLIEQLL
jgi:hypothetical protein